MIEIKNKVDCCGCYACYNCCPKNCIKMECDDEKFVYPVVDYDKCIKCGKCLKVCPTFNEVKDLEVSLKSTFACKSKCSEIINNSSSGGIIE